MVFLIVGVVMLLTVTVRILRSDANPLILLGLWGFMLICLGFVGRLYRVGVYVSDRGVRVVNVLHTRTLTWAEVNRVYLAPLKVPVIGTWPTMATSIWIELADGKKIQTMLNSQSAEFLLRRRAFADAFAQIESCCRAVRENA